MPIIKVFNFTKMRIKYEKSWPTYKNKNCRCVNWKKYIYRNNYIGYIWYITIVAYFNE